MNIKSLLSVTALASLMFATGCNTMYAKERDYNSVGQPTDSYAKQLSYASGYNFYYKTGLDDVKVKHEDYVKIQQLEGKEFTDTGIKGFIDDGNNAAIVNFAGTMYGGAGFGLGLGVASALLSIYTEMQVEKNNVQKFPFFAYQEIDQTQTDKKQSLIKLMKDIASAMELTLADFSYTMRPLADNEIPDIYVKTEFENVSYMPDTNKYLMLFRLFDNEGKYCSIYRACVFSVVIPDYFREGTVPRIIPNIANEQRYIYDKTNYDYENAEPTIYVNKNVGFSTTEFIYKLSTKLPDWIYIVNRGHHDNINTKQWIPPMIFNHGKIHFFVVDKDAENK